MFSLDISCITQLNYQLTDVQYSIDLKVIPDCPQFKTLSKGDIFEIQKLLK